MHTDVLSVLPPSHCQQRTYIVTFVDDFSRYAYTYTSKKKSEVAQKFKQFLLESKRDLGEEHKVDTLRSDNGTEYINTEMKRIVVEYGTLWDTAPAYTKPPNGTAE